MTIKVKVNKIKSNVRAKLQIRQTIDGKVMILDHDDIDIIIIPKDKKVLTIPTEDIDDNIYDTQNRYFKYLNRKGLIEPATILSGNIYGSLEAQYLDSQKENISVIDLIILNTARWLEEERPYFADMEEIKDREEERLLEPNEEESTELGEVPEKSVKGNLTYGYNPYDGLLEEKKK